ncbi:MAG: RIP metalloprotease RseP [Muribaculaceae bacterium]|nr:RIP metalloprotease RseP [Muribaculaceae bacterium]
MQTFLIQALQFVVALGLLIVIHEFGHYFFSRLFGIKVNRFYLFFNPYFSLVKYYPREGVVKFIASSKTAADGTEQEKAAATVRVSKPHPATPGGKTTWRDTVYGIGWVPLGGYCDIAGMIDETKSADDLAATPEPWEFRTKPAWQRLLVMAGGVLFNFLLAVAIYVGIAQHWGEKYIPFDAATEGFDFVPAAQAVGFRNGDIPLAADGKKLDAADSDYMLKMVEAKNVTVLRQHRDTVNIAIPSDFIFRLNDDKGFLTYRLPVYIDKLVNGMPAQRAGLEVGDRIVTVGNTITPSYTELEAALKEHAGQETTVSVIRGDDDLLLFAITPTPTGKLGFNLRPIDQVYPAVTKKYGFFESIPRGWALGTSTLTNYVKSMKHVASKEGVQQLGGFGAIGSMFPEKWNWLSFWEITAFISLALAFMNIIPIPALDGGHIMFLLWEMCTGRKVPLNVLVTAQYIGMGFLFLLLIYANGNDIFRAFFK